MSVQKNRISHIEFKVQGTGGRIEDLAECPGKPGGIPARGRKGPTPTPPYGERHAVRRGFLFFFKAGYYAESHPVLMPFFCGIGKGPGDGSWGFNRCVRRVAQRFRVLVEKWGKRECWVSG